MITVKVLQERIEVTEQIALCRLLYAAIEIAIPDLAFM
jgi:hypothetical protein